MASGYIPATLFDLAANRPTVLTELTNFVASDTGAASTGFVDGTGATVWIPTGPAGGPSGADAVTGLVATTAGNPYTQLLRVAAGAALKVTLLVPLGGGFVDVSLMGGCVIPDAATPGAVYFQLVVAATPIVRAQFYIAGDVGIGPDFHYRTIALKDRIAVAAGSTDITVLWKSDNENVTIDPDMNQLGTPMILTANFSRT